jgi:hypothetical protein
VVWYTAAVLFLPLMTGAQAAAVDYREVFREDYRRAEQYLDESAWMADTLKARGFDPCFAFAVIFPELIRYSIIMDRIETRSLEVLYVQYGTQYANFSIGHFQMKPSFAESVEKDMVKYRNQAQDPWPAEFVFSDTNDVTDRKSRLFRLQSMRGQLYYLQAFMRVVNHLYPDWDSLSPDIRVQYYAAAYHGGYQRGKDAIEAMARKKYFYTGLQSSGTKYSYADISLYYFQHCACYR